MNNPRCDGLIYSVATVMDNCLTLNPPDMAGKEEYEGQIILWYKQIISCQDTDIKNSAAYMFAKKYIKNSLYDQAEQLLETIPGNHMDKSVYKWIYCCIKSNMMRQQRLSNRSC